MNTPTFSLAVFVAMKRVCKGEMCFPASLQRCAIIDECKHADVMSQLFSNYLPQSFFRCFLAKAKSCPALVTHRHTHTYILYMLLFPHTPCVSPLNPLQLTFSSWHYVLSQYKLNRGPRRNKAYNKWTHIFSKENRNLIFQFFKSKYFLYFQNSTCISSWFYILLKRYPLGINILIGGVCHCGDAHCEKEKKKKQLDQSISLAVKIIIQSPDMFPYLFFCFVQVPNMCWIHFGNIIVYIYKLGIILLVFNLLITS